MKKLLFMMLLIPILGFGQTLNRNDSLPKKDTVKVILLLSDTETSLKTVYIYKGLVNYNPTYEATSTETTNNSVIWQYGYEVRIIEYGIKWISDCAYQENYPFYTHLKYLDGNKEPFKSAIVVWQSKNISDKN